MSGLIYEAIMEIEASISPDSFLELHRWKFYLHFFFVINVPLLEEKLHIPIILIWLGAEVPR